MVSFFKGRAWAAESSRQVLEVGTADWFGPSATMMAGVKEEATLMPMRVVERRNSVSLSPGAFGLYTADAYEHRAPPALPVVPKPPLAPPPPGLTPALCHAVLRDDPACLESVWPALSVDARTAIVTTAAAVGANQVIRQALAWGPAHEDLANRADGGVAGNTPLHYAALCSQDQSAALLLAAGAKANASNPVETLPLHDAARIGNLALVRMLLAHKANAAATNKYGDHMLHRCALYADADAARYVAVMRHGVAAVRAQGGEAAALAFVNHTNRDGFTPLDMAMACGQPLLAQCLGDLGGEHGARFLAGTRAWARWDVDHEKTWAQDEVPKILAAQTQDDTVAA